jgi:hypothetical protein
MPIKPPCDGRYRAVREPEEGLTVVVDVGWLPEVLGGLGLVGDVGPVDELVGTGIGV